jgi:hypothetical protein
MRDIGKIKYPKRMFWVPVPAKAVPVARKIRTIEQ